MVYFKAKKQDSENVDFFNTFTQRLFDNPELTQEEAIRQMYPGISGVQTAEKLQENFMADVYIQAAIRQEIVVQLIRNHVPVKLYGHNWDTFLTKAEVLIKDNLTFIKKFVKVCGEVTYGELPAIYNNARFSVNQLPWFKAGIHDRTPLALMNGCVSITDGSTYMRREIPMDSGVEYYSLDELETMGNKDFSRRGFLKTLGLTGAALTIGPAFNKVEAATAIVEGRKTITGNNALPHRTLGTGKAAFEVSALGFGVMGMTYNRSQHPDKKQCIRLLHEAVERGVTLFDTAIIYGPLTNENLAGEALSEFKGRINVTTKFGHEVIAGKATGRQDSSRKTIRQYCEDSLRRLKLETLPMFYQHRADPNTPAEEVAQTISELMKEGKVQHWGMCEVSADTIRKAHAVCPLTAIQSEYHLMHRLVEENGVLDVCRELGIGFVPYSPINRGFLGGTLNEYTVFDVNNDNRHTLPRFQPDTMRANTRIVNVLQDFGRPLGMTSAQVALGWLLQKAPWIVPIPGTTKLSHLEENLRTFDFNLSSKEWHELENAVAAIPVMGDRYNAEQQRQVGR